LRPSLAAAALAALALATPAAAPVAAQEPPRRITVTGSASVEAVPDLATVTAGVETRAATAAEALAANGTAMTAVFAALEGAGIERRDIQTSQLSLNPVYDNPEVPTRAPQVTGYDASNMVTIKVREVGRLGAVIDAATTAGGNRLYGVGFEVSDPHAVLDDAREKAVADARGKAELFARAGGVGLGPVLSIRETPPMGGPTPMFARAEAAAGPPVSEGTVSLSTEVEVVYAIE
jgi:uncharacterized protein